MANARTRLANRFCAESPPPHPVDTLLAAAAASAAQLVTFTPDDIDWKTKSGWRWKNVRACRPTR